MDPVALVMIHRPATREAMYRRRLIHKVRTLWIEGVLEPSLHGAARIELGLTYQPQAVEHSGAGMVQAATNTHHMLPPDTSLHDIFQAGQRELLILGAPGAGKTTLVLELGRDLLACAEQDERQPMPVVFNLASWATQRRPLAEWLIDELNERYGVPRQIGQAWMAADQLLPLLDGLDEVRQEHRVACIEATNAFRRTHRVAGLVVCSRRADYAVLETHLDLAATVLIQPLTPAQIDSYLAQADDQLAALRAALDSDPKLQEVAETSLMLSIMTQVYQGVPVDSLQLRGTLSERRRHLFAAYVERMVHGRAGDPHYLQAQTLHWLCWLARALLEQGQSIFLIERLQPDWLPTRVARRQYTLVDRLGWGLGMGLILGLLPLFVLPLTDPWINPVHAALTSALAVSLLVGLFGGQSDTPARESPPTKQLLRNMLRGYLVVGLGMGLCTWLAIRLGLNPIVDIVDNESHPFPNLLKAFPLTPTSWLLSGLIAGGVGGALAGALSGAPSLRPRRIAIVERLRWSLSKARPAALGGFITGAVGVGGIQMLIILSVIGEPGGALSDLQWKGSPLSWFLLVMLVSWVSSVLFFGIPYMLTFGLAGGLTGGEAEAKAQPNQGIWRSARSAIVSALIVGVSFGVHQWGVRLVLGSDEVGVALVTGLSAGLIGGLALGGYGCLSHLALRLVLWRTHSLPWHLARFLDYCNDHSFLYKVGGGYIFVHRELQEYLATLLPPDQAGQTKAL